MHKIDKHEFTSALQREWTTDSRWDGITRPYSADDVHRLRGSIDIEYSLARYGAARLWQLLQEQDYVHVLSAITGNQAIQEVQAGVEAIYVSGRQVGAGPNNAHEMYPPQSLYPPHPRPPTPTALRAPRAIATNPPAASSPGSARPRAFSACATASRRPSPARSPTRHTPTCCGSRRRSRT